MRTGTFGPRQQSWRAEDTRPTYIKRLEKLHFQEKPHTRYLSWTGCTYSFLNLCSSAAMGWSPFQRACRSSSVGSGSGISILTHQTSDVSGQSPPYSGNTRRGVGSGPTLPFYQQGEQLLRFAEGAVRGQEGSHEVRI